MGNHTTIYYNIQITCHLDILPLWTVPQGLPRPPFLGLWQDGTRQQSDPSLEWPQ